MDPSKSKKGTKPYVKIETDLLGSPAWAELPTTARALFLDLRAKLRGNNNGNIECTLTDLRHHGWKSEHTLAMARWALLSLGFLKQTRQGIVIAGKRRCSLFAFTDLPTCDYRDKDTGEVISTYGLPTLEFKKYVGRREARAALDTGMARYRQEARGRQLSKTPVQKRHATRSRIARVGVPKLNA